LTGAKAHHAIPAYSQLVRLPRITGKELFAAYRDHDGPGNIAHHEMWQIHTSLTEAPFEIDRLVKERSETEVVKQFLSTACYPEHGLPLLLYFAQNHSVDVEATLLANANAGGDNVHRGMVLGLIVGAANDELPEHLIKGLLACDELKNEIEAFADIVLSGQGI